MSSKKQPASEKRKKHEGRIRIKVSDFGPIGNGEVELRSLTVFAGPSNTGKSWLATLIYVFEQHFKGDKNAALAQLLYSGHGDQKPQFPERPDVWLECIAKKEAISLTVDDKKVLAIFLKDRCRDIETEILRCFGLSELRHLSREGSGKAASVTVLDDDAIRSPATCFHFAVSGDEALSPDIEIADQLKLQRIPPPFYEQFSKKFAEDIQDDKLSPWRVVVAPFLFKNDNAGYYLPADRGGVMHLYHTIVSALVRNASRISPGRNTPMLSGVMGDFLQNLLDIDIEKQGHTESDRAESLERKLLKGSISIEKSDIEYPRFAYSPADWGRFLSFLNVSSMVSELAPVALYLRHHVREGDLLILEEPEAHLHPAMQVAFVREIAEWVRQGIRVILTTHSEWVLEELANIVAAGEAGETDGLGRQAVGMWLFEPQQSLSGATRIREIGWDPDEGGFATDFDDVARNLHNKWAELMNRSQ